MKIELRKDNVVKRVASEDEARVLEARGFFRTDGKTARKTSSDAEVKALNEQLVRAAEVIEAADRRKGELEKELADTKAELEEASRHAEDADKQIASLTQELEGTREQLETAVKKNKTTEKK